MKYILVDRNPVPADDLLQWAVWIENVNRKVAVTTVGNATVSTVFLGLDHNFRDEGPPILWETVVFGGKYDQFMRRYASEADARAGHEETVVLVRASMAKEWSPRDKGRKATDGA